MADKVGLNGESIAHLDEDSFIKPDAKYRENWYDFLNWQRTSWAPTWKFAHNKSIRPALISYSVQKKDLGGIGYCGKTFNDATSRES